MGRITWLMRHVFEVALVTESAMWVLRPRFSIKDKESISSPFMIDDPGIGSTRGLTIPVKQIALEPVHVLRPISSLVLRHEEPYRIGIVVTKNAIIEISA